MQMIRDGIKEDAEKIAKIKIDNWRKTYSKIFPEDFLNNLDVTKEKEKYLNNLKNKNIIIYEKEEKPIAYCYYGKSENTKFKDYEGEVFALYVENNCQEHGVGTKLLQYAIKDLAKKSKKIFLWCAKENTRAISFYKKNGFKIIGEEIENIGGKNVEKVALGISLEDEKIQEYKSEREKINEKIKEDKSSEKQAKNEEKAEKIYINNSYNLKKSASYIENEQSMAIYANPDLIFLKDEPRNWFTQIINHKIISDIPKNFIDYLLKKEIIEKNDNSYCSNL